MVRERAESYHTAKLTATAEERILPYRWKQMVSDQQFIERHIKSAL